MVIENAMNQAKDWKDIDLSLVPVHQVPHFHLSRAPTRVDFSRISSEIQHQYAQWMSGQIIPLLGKLRGQHQFSVLLIFQGMDASGKDGAIRSLFMNLDPLAMRMVRFVPPTAEESGHDFLWRVHRVSPHPGELVFFNRSHYEEALVQKVRHGISAREFQKLKRHIIHFEDLLADSRVCILKCFLHISKKTQYERFKSRLEDPLRRWKLSEMDIQDRKRWGPFMDAYDELMLATSKPSAPWYVIPADDKYLRDLYIAQLLMVTLKNMNLTTSAASSAISDLPIDP